MLSVPELGDWCKILELILKISSLIKFTRFFISYFTFLKNLIINSERWVYATLIIFLGSFIIGMIYSLSHPELLKTIIQIFQDKFGAAPIGWKLALMIFKQNLLVALMCLIGGIVLGLLPLGLIFFNGFILGYIITITFKLLPLSILAKAGFLIVTLLPHGLLELPAIFFAAIMGARLGLRWTAKSASGRRGLIIKEDFTNALKVIPVIALTLFFSAIVEVFFSEQLGMYLFRGVA